MKIADIVKLMDNKSQVFIYSESEYLDCYLERDSYDCEDCDDDIGCGNCSHRIFATNEWESYRGTADKVPIKLSERKVIELNVRERDVIVNKRGKKEKQTFLGIKVND